ncbi:unnamed protein product [Caenorhabditis brenneri]
MTSGISFNRGSKMLKLENTEKAVLIGAIEFPDEFSKFKNETHKQGFWRNFKNDVTRFHEKIEHRTSGIYDDATAAVAKWIIEEASENEEKKDLSVFSPNGTSRNLRTALVQCNFTDVSRLIDDFRSKIRQGLSDNKPYTEMVVTENYSIHEVIDKISETKPNSLCMLIIRQFESLHSRFLDNLISLLYSDVKCNKTLPRVRLMVCVSTSPTYFRQNCEIETMNMLELKQFEFTKLDDIFSEIMSTGVHRYFQPPKPAPKKIEEDDPEALRSYDCSPALFSGQFMTYLKDRFFGCDYSICALTRAVEFALLQKYIEDPFWREDDDHSEELKKYDETLELFLEVFGEEIDYGFLKMHIRIQSDPNLWQEMRNETPFKEKKQFYLESKSKKNIIELCDRIMEAVINLDAHFYERLVELKKKLEKANTESEEKKKQRNAITLKQNNPILTAKSAIFEHVMTLFETVLKPYPAGWRNVIGASSWSDDTVKKTLDSTDEYNIEQCLLNVENNSTMPLAVAWRSLLCHRNFKTVSIKDWAQLFLDNTNLSREQAKQAFFAAAGQLEHIGLIRGSADRKSTNVNVLYHPISFIPSI